MQRPPNKVVNRPFLDSPRKRGSKPIKKNAFVDLNRILESNMDLVMLLMYEQAV